MQIIQSGPSKATLRQQALDQAMGNIVGGIGQASNQLAKNEETVRQQALQMGEARMKLQDMGFDNNAISDEQLAAELGIKKPKGIGLQGMFEKEEAPKKYASIFSGPRNEDWKFKREKELADMKFKQEGEVLDRQFKRAQIASTEAEAQKKRNEAMNGPTPTEGQFKAAGFSKRARQAEAELSRIPENTGTGFMARVSGILPNEMVPENIQLMEQAKRNFISANLRKESGAAISDQEYENEDKKYFPQPGDSKSVIAQKARAREQAMLNLEAEGNPAMSRIATAPSGNPLERGAISNTARAVDPAQIKVQLKGMTRADKIRLLQGQ